ncbi:hypothetical protein FB451DRAFT_1519079, partial [Mycena latifolia]
MVQSRHQEPATVALLETLVEALWSSTWGEQDETVIAGLITPPLLPTDTAVNGGDTPSADIGTFKLRAAEARVAFLAEFLFYRLSDHAAPTLRLLDFRIWYTGHPHAVHASDQIRFAYGLRDILQKADGHTDFIEQLLMIFGHQNCIPPAPHFGWLDNPTACTTITESLDEYITRVCQTRSDTVDSEFKQKLENNIRGWRRGCRG